MENQLKQVLMYFEAMSDKSYGGKTLKAICQNGILTYEGCNGDFGCCSRSLDIEDSIDALKELLK